ncbi:peroxiredoxin family protein [Dactylosporangium sp. CS-033363]|uniref:peroxiredoxin family protein n=1 Tax=Dactylosporangium sp. CS-033363 TaxID=3239935 RepID=UPI003D915850
MGAAVIVLTVLVVLDLLLTTAVIRRLRTYEERAGSAGPARELIEISVGAEVPLAEPALIGRRTLVGFFSTTCRPCVLEAAELAGRQERLAAAGIVAVPVLTMYGGTDPNGLAEALGRVGTVIAEAPGGAVVSAFGAKATPSYALVDPDGRVAAKGTFEDCLRLVAR